MPKAKTCGWKAASAARTAFGVNLHQNGRIEPSTGLPVVECAEVALQNKEGCCKLGEFIEPQRPHEFRFGHARVGFGGDEFTARRIAGDLHRHAFDL